MEAARPRDGDGSRRRCTGSRSVSTSRRSRCATERASAAARRAFGLPESAFVVGSFQKDGVGWGEGLEPKLIKGPDVLVDTARRGSRARPRARASSSRGRRAGTSGPGSSGSGSRIGTRSCPTSTRSRRRTRRSTSALVASRDEGGPRAVLESMATGVPLVTTRVGQAADLVEHGVNGVDGRRRGRRAPRGARSRTSPARRPTSSQRMRTAGRATAEAELVSGAPASVACAPRRLRRDAETTREPVDLSAARGREVRRVPRAGGRGCSRRGGSEPGVRVFYGHDHVPAPGERAAGGTAKAQKLERALPEQPDGLLARSTSGRRGCRATSGRFCGLRDVAARRSSSTRTASRTRAGPAATPTALNDPLRRARSRCRPRRVPERVLQALGRRVPRKAARHLGDPPQRGRHDALHAGAGAPAGRSGAASRRRSDAGVPARARAPDARRSSSDPARRADCSSRVGS